MTFANCPSCSYGFLYKSRSCKPTGWMRYFKTFARCHTCGALVELPGPLLGGPKIKDPPVDSEPLESEGQLQKGGSG